MTGAEKIEKGDTVAWNWGGSSIQGEVKFVSFAQARSGSLKAWMSPSYYNFLAVQVTKKFTEHAEIESKGKTITRNGDENNPAYKVERPGKNPVLKKVRLTDSSQACAQTKFLHKAKFPKSEEYTLFLLCDVDADLHMAGH